MHKLTYILPIVFLITVFSCQEKPVEAKIVAPLEIVDYPIPFIRDAIDARVIPSLQKETTWFGTAHYEPIYIGLYQDTVESRYYYPFAPKELDEEERKQLKERDITYYNKYNLDWLDERPYKRWHKAEVDLKIDTTHLINERSPSYPVMITNTAPDTIFVGYGGLIPLKLEAKDSSGLWKPIEQRFVFMCGNGVGDIILPPKEIVIVAVEVPNGNYSTQLRLNFGINYSKVFNGSINYRQFKHKFNDDGDYCDEYKKENNLE